MKFDTIGLIALGVGGFILLNGFTNGGVSKEISKQVVDGTLNAGYGVLEGTGEASRNFADEKGFLPAVNYYNKFFNITNPEWIGFQGFKYLGDKNKWLS